VIVGKRLSLNPIVIFLPLLFWGWIWGVVGLFLATPILVTALISANKLNLLGVQHIARNEPKIKGAGKK
jgi:predicted PurR-regulated permease PerM